MELSNSYNCVNINNISTISRKVNITTKPLTIENSVDFVNKRKLTMIIAAVAILISTLVYVGTYSESVTTVNVMSVNVNVLLNKSGVAQIIETLTIPYNHETLFGGSSFYVDFDYLNSLGYNITFNSVVSATPGFNIISHSPAFPVTIKEHGTLEIIMKISVPKQDFAGGVSVNILSS